jgi:hypothetical protein
MNSKIRGDHSGEVMSNIGTIDLIRGSVAKGRMARFLIEITNPFIQALAQDLTGIK